ncbi:MAG TPA: DUF3261 domain-containing protein [Oleiagrimonas sp.]|nr:DUF3261 domain-containing protein [Oleiagrimonas sp.]
MRSARLLLPLLLTVLAAGCATVPMPYPSCVAIGPAGSACPLPPQALPAVAARHVVTITHDGQSQTFLGRLNVDQQALRLAGASLFGTHLFTITWDGTRVTSEPPERKLHPKLMVVMLEMALANPDALRPRLHGMELKVENAGDGEVRTLYEHGHLVARIERHGDELASSRLRISIPPAGLHIRLDPLSGTP